MLRMPLMAATALAVFAVPALADPTAPAGAEAEVIVASLPISGSDAGPTSDSEITPEELALLAPVETIDATTDIRGYLRRGVPTALRNAALRQAWLSRPAVKEYTGLEMD